MEYTFEKEGVRINGTFIRYNTDLADIKPSFVDLLSNQMATGWSVFLIHRAVLDLKEEINEHSVCPINVEAIRKISRDSANEEIKKQPAKLWIKGIGIFKDMIVIATLIGLVFALLSK